MVRFVGMDVHKRVVEVCVLDERGKVRDRHRFSLTRESLVTFAKKHLTKDDQVVVESTTNTWGVVEILRPFVGKMVVSNPHQTKAIAHAKVKTDKVDAKVLAQLLRCDFLPLVWEPDPKTRSLRRIVSRRTALVADRTAVKNRIHSLLAQRLYACPHADMFGRNGRRWMASLKLDRDGKEAFESDMKLLDGIQTELDKLDGILREEAHRNDQARLLMTQPGVDVATAVTVVASLGDIHRFKSGDHAASYLGLVPSTRQSANHCYHGSITKRGSSEARRALVQGAQTLSRHPGPLGVFFRRLASKKNRNVAVTATARKLIVIAWHMLKNNEPYRYAEPRRTKIKLRLLRNRVEGPQKRDPRRSKKGILVPPGKEAEVYPPLGDIYQREGLPPMKELARGEKKAIKQAAVSSFVRGLKKDTIYLRKKWDPDKKGEGNA